MPYTEVMFTLTLLKNHYRVDTQIWKKKNPCVFPVCTRTFLIQGKIQHTCTRIKYCAHVYNRNKYREEEKYISYT